MARQRHDGLHRAFAEGPGAHHDCPVMILQGTGHDLRGRGRAAIDQDHHRPAVGQIATSGIEALNAVGPPTAGRHDLTAIEEGIGGGDRLLEQAAWIVAQIEHQALHALAELALQRVDGAAQLGLGLLIERGDPDIADIALSVGTHRRDGDHRARHADIERIVPAGAAQGQRDQRVDRPPHLLDRLGQAHAHHRLAVDVGDHVAGLDASPERRRVVDRRNDLDQAVLHRDLDAQPAELALGLDLHVAIALGVEIARMWIKGGEHAVDRGLDQRLVGHLLDIFAAHAFEHVAEQLELPEGVR